MRVVAGRESEIVRRSRGDTVHRGRNVAGDATGLDAGNAAGDMADGFMDRGSKDHGEEGEEESRFECKHCGEDENY